MSVGRKAKWDKEFEQIKQRTYEAMSKPQPNCETCGTKLTPLNRIWNGNRWVCYQCQEKNQQ